MTCPFTVINSSYSNVTFVLMLCLLVFFQWILILFIKTIILKRRIKLFLTEYLLLTVLFISY